MMYIQCDNRLCGKSIKDGRPHLQLTMENDPPTFSDPKSPKHFCDENCLEEWITQ